MTSHARNGFIVFLLILSTTIVLVSSAQASSWLILNSAGTTATELKASLTGEADGPDLTLLSTFFGVKFALTCTNFVLINFNLEKGGKLTEGASVEFTGCAFYGKGTLEEPLPCVAQSPGFPVGTIVTAELKGEFTGSGARIEPKAKEGAFLTLRNEKPECFLAEVNTFRGTLVLEDCEKQPESEPCINRAETHEIKHLLQVSASTSLSYFKATATAAGSSWIKLSGAHAGLKWSGMS
jgi:hypothetical protein